MGKPIVSPDQRSTMACADIDMDIQGDDEEPWTPDRRDPPMMQYYQATELMPDNKGPLHDLLQKQPAVLGVRKLEQIKLKITNS